MQERVLYLYNSINDIYQGYYLIDGETPSRGQIGGRSYTGANGITVNENTAEISNDLVTSGGTIGGNTQIDGDLTIDGNIYQRGSAYETHAEKIYTKKDMIITRDGAESPLGADELTGFKAKHYDVDGNDGILAFDRNGTARVGDYTKDKVFTVYSSDGVAFYSDSEMTEEVTIPDGVTPELVEGNEYTYTQDVNDTEPILTRSEETDLNHNDILMWNSTQKKAVNVPRPSLNNTVLTAKIQNNQTTYEWKSGGSAGVAFKGTRSAYNTAKLIPEGSDGHIPSGALVIITDEGKTYITEGTGSSQTLEPVANATFNGSHAQWNALTSAQKAMYNIVNFNDDEAIGLTKARKVYHQSKVYVWDCYTHYVVSVTGATLAQIQSFLTSVSYNPSNYLQGLLSRRTSVNQDVRSATFTITTGGIINSWYADGDGTEHELSSTDIVYGQFVLPIEEK